MQRYNVFLRQKLIKKRSEYYRYINVIHSNFSNFVDYIEELLDQLKKISKNKIAKIIYWDVERFDKKHYFDEKNK